VQNFQILIVPVLSKSVNNVCKLLPLLGDFNPGPYLDFARDFTGGPSAP